MFHITELPFVLVLYHSLTHSFELNPMISIVRQFAHALEASLQPLPARVAFDAMLTAAGTRV